MTDGAALEVVPDSRDEPEAAAALQQQERQEQQEERQEERQEEPEAPTKALRWWEQPPYVKGPPAGHTTSTASNKHVHVVDADHGSERSYGTSEASGAAGGGGGVGVGPGPSAAMGAGDGGDCTGEMADRRAYSGTASPAGEVSERSGVSHTTSATSATSDTTEDSYNLLDLRNADNFTPKEIDIRNQLLDVIKMGPSYIDAAQAVLVASMRYVSTVADSTQDDIVKLEQLYHRHTHPHIHRGKGMSMEAFKQTRNEVIVSATRRAIDKLRGQKAKAKATDNNAGREEGDGGEGAGAGAGEGEWDQEEWDRARGRRGGGYGPSNGSRYPRRSERFEPYGRGRGRGGGRYSRSPRDDAEDYEHEQTQQQRAAVNNMPPGHVPYCPPPPPPPSISMMTGVGAAGYGSGGRVRGDFVPPPPPAPAPGCYNGSPPMAPGGFAASPTYHYLRQTPTHTYAATHTHLMGPPPMFAPHAPRMPAGVYRPPQPPGAPMIPGGPGVQFGMGRPPPPMP
ncbi:unnamed protein product [Vitrella brassicaformis CCMP3155]|uniref:Uncharacterized protein n=3 Tax=Vitrella brassicaformis TaxID=1169539 RepID=A0A0G4FNT5_VITBC|nr:unnamed protein product [Vitrella brassicaformis CCMP3155]|eukprot:CEM15847.1 unnamed protein product [Vitrella brassicaformis CCMP3155]